VSADAGAVANFRIGLARCPPMWYWDPFRPYVAYLATLECEQAHSRMIHMRETVTFLTS
jgi:hypothetical protein